MKKNLRPEGLGYRVLTWCMQGHSVLRPYQEEKNQMLLSFASCSLP
jgi:hypothetical protein